MCYNVSVITIIQLKRRFFKSKISDLSYLNSQNDDLHRILTSSLCNIF